MYIKIKYLHIAVFFFLTGFLSAQNEKARKYLVEGNKNYLANMYDEAAANYLRAIQEGEDSYKSNFNLGNALYKLKKYDDALLQYEKSSKFATGKIEESNVHFNIGDCYYQKKEYDKAAETFKKVLKLNPGDEKARYNYALARQKLNEQQQNQQEQQQNRKDDKKDKGEGQDKNRKQEQQQPDSSENQPKNDKENNQQGQSGGTGENQPGQGNGKEKGQNAIENVRSHATDETSPEQEKNRKQYYEGILGAMKEQEKRAQQKIINKKLPPSQNKRGKDW
ncbi:MAG: tetratricopeptide repeat protein [Flavobacteriaceae bacterium]|jgi:tetratricopeptide (TPR) repeat protein|nr:tetratricopeptide repeat protein [Flavobacteriaceae bacterium]